MRKLTSVASIWAQIQAVRWTQLSCDACAAMCGVDLSTAAGRYELAGGALIGTAKALHFSH
eukprot:1849216-Rhodomonas_salina.1